ncbi:MAG: hypothetical protein JKY54_02490 [Flavobacteriales bacterium]|nr:hypothetical protein [Flavobacteriales bacterium]
MIKSYSFILLLIFSSPIWSQDQVENKPAKIVFGLEQDVLPYLLKGYIITGWTGREYFRYRFSYASATTPDFIHAENVNSDQVKAFGISFEYL